MGRVGIVDYVGNVESYDLFGEKTNFRAITTKLVEDLVKQGKWFGFCTRVDDSQVDIFSLENKSGIKMGRMVHDLLCSECGYRTTLYRYLLHDFLCYCEVPTVRKSDGYSGFKDSYNKSLVTCNLNVIAEWLGISYEEARLQYGARLSENDFDIDDELYPYVKLSVDKGVRKVSRPRKDLDLSVKGTRIIPLYAIEKGIEVLYDMCSKDFYNITFVKDSGQERTINICFDYDKLCSVYKDKGLLVEAFEEQFKGDFLNSNTLSRGYIRVIEVGTNLANHASRSINLARILKVEKAEPDLTFVDIDLDSVKSTFLAKLDKKGINYKELVDTLELFQVGSTREYNNSPISSYSELENWVEMQEVLLSTPFTKQLALFMLGNPQWFDGYTGARDIPELREYDFGDDSSDDDDDFDLFLDI